MQVTRVRSLGQEDPLQKEEITHSGIHAWRNPLDTRAWWATVYEVTKESDTTQRLNNNNDNTITHKSGKPENTKENCLGYTSGPHPQPGLSFRDTPLNLATHCLVFVCLCPEYHHYFYCHH